MSSLFYILIYLLMGIGIYLIFGWLTRHRPVADYTRPLFAAAVICAWPVFVVCFILVSFTSLVESFQDQDES